LPAQPHIENGLTRLKKSQDQPKRPLILRLFFTGFQYTTLGEWNCSAGISIAT
jgi:hypothetical protein